MLAVLRRLVALAAIAAIGLTLAGCYRDFGPVVAEPEPLPPPTVNTRLQLGDRLTVTVFSEPTLSGVYDITPGGFIDMPLIGQIKAIGRTHSELESRNCRSLCSRALPARAESNSRRCRISTILYFRRSRKAGGVSLSGRPQRTYCRHDCWWPDLSWTQGYRSDPARRPASVERISAVVIGRDPARRSHPHSGALLLTSITCRSANNYLQAIQYEPLSISAARVAIRSDQKASVLRNRNSISYTRFDLALAQSVPCRAPSSCHHSRNAVSGGPPPLLPPQVAPLPTGDQSLALGQWLISGAVGVSTFYNSNIYQSTTPPILHGPGFEIKPSLLADFNTGIYETSIYGNIDSSIYPTLDSSNDTFNRQAGILQKYSPLPDLLFTAQGNYAHSTNATVLLNSTTPAATSIPSPIVSPANPALPGAAGVVANAQTVVDPNDTYTAAASVYKEFNRAYAVFGGSISDTTYETTPSSNYNLAAYYVGGGIWFSPLFYAFAERRPEFLRSPAVGFSSTSYFVKSGIGSDRIGFFQGSIYAGEHATVVADNAGEAGGDIYGGAISYFPIEPWNMTFSVDRLRNVSNITVATSQALGGTYGYFTQRGRGRLGPFRGGNIDEHVGTNYHACLPDKLHVFAADVGLCRC